MLEVADDVRHTRATAGAGALPSLLGPVQRGKRIATKFADDVRALSVPDTDASRKAAIYFEDFARIAFETLAAEERRVRALPEEVTLLESTRALNHLEVALVSAFFSMTTYRIIPMKVPELEEPFEKADSCKELDTLGTE